MAAGRFVQRGRRLTFAAAGHPPAILISSGTLRLLDSQSAILGSLADVIPSESVDEFDLTSGDRLVLYTDGFIEVFNRSDEMLGVDGLEDLIRRSAKLALPEMKKAILSGITAWRNGGPLTDDMSLVIVEVRWLVRHDENNWGIFGSKIEMLCRPTNSGVCPAYTSRCSFSLGQVRLRSAYNCSRRCLTTTSNDSR